MYFVTQLGPTLFAISRTVALRGFSRQEYWSGLSFSTPGDIPNPGINSFVVLLVAVKFLPIIKAQLFSALSSYLFQWELVIPSSWSQGYSANSPYYIIIIVYTKLFVFSTSHIVNYIMSIVRVEYLLQY